MDIDLLPYQYDFITSNHPNLALTGSVGTGKTLAGAYFVLAMVTMYPKSKGMITANTHAQLVNSTLTPLIQLCEELKIPYSTSIGTKKMKILGTTIYIYSLEKYENIRGIEVGWIWCDEFFLNKSKRAYDVIKTRLRDNKGPLYFRATTTKNGFNWGYDLYASPKRTNNFKVIDAMTEQNPFLPKQFMRDLLEDYGSVDSPMYKQEVLNQYVNLTAGSVYWSFDRNTHVKTCELETAYHTYIGVDFNIDNMSAICCQMRGDTLYVCKEITLKDVNANTFTLADSLCKELFKYPYRSIVPDSTGKARKTSSHKSDHQILRDAGFKLETTRNPLIRDRQNAVNKLFTVNKIVIDSSCNNLINELETLSARDNEGDTVHISVALGYIVHLLNPFTNKQKSSQFSYR